MTETEFLLIFAALGWTCGPFLGAWLYWRGRSVQSPLPQLVAEKEEEQAKPEPPKQVRL